MATYLSCANAVDNLSDAFMHDAVAPTYLSHRNPGLVKTENSGDLFVLDLRVPVGVAGDVVASPATLCRSVGSIDSVVSEEQMGRVYARRNIALMADVADWHFAMCQEPTYSMSAENAALESNMPISVIILSCGPKPAVFGISLGDFGPKASGYVHHLRIAGLLEWAN